MNTKTKKILMAGVTIIVTLLLIAGLFLPLQKTEDQGIQILKGTYSNNETVKPEVYSYYYNITKIYDGTNGINGKNGKDGISGTTTLWNNQTLFNTMTLWNNQTITLWNNQTFTYWHNGTDGINGLNGQDGKDGVNGQDGNDGNNGIDAPVNQPAIVTIYGTTYCKNHATIEFNVVDNDNVNLWILAKCNTDKSGVLTVDEFFGGNGNYTAIYKDAPHCGTLNWTIVVMDGSDITFATTEQVI